ncbi:MULTISPECIES: YfbU family protein [Pseudomonas]|uniref:YfbU family protein n=1 Tax=Pseudomonas TaxID=286 RepID=UPI001AE56E76|nr:MULTISPECIES: YfbU family protein [unclassified Pseudomonas]MBP1126471.1 uncharacterized protein YfbU (UPF0304 family) [Pseudomonas sp. PvP025]MDQ0400331.1 uncharacterized protein YfbU (UPF0304 family) [Pseudomonas sp. PvP006]
MEFTNEQKLIITLLTDIHAALEIRDSVDPSFVQDAVSSGRTWALEWQYPGIFEGRAETPAQVLFVVSVLEMWERLERSYAELNKESHANIAERAAPFGGKPVFPGFDGNGGDGDAYGTANLLINQMGRWTSFQSHDLNSHMPMSDSYQRMLETLSELDKGHADYYFSQDEIVALLRSRIHPENR